MLISHQSECANERIKEFVALRPKVYSLDVEVRSGLSEKELKTVLKMSAKKLKGVAKSAVRKYCTHEAYKAVLNTPGPPKIVDFRKIVVQVDNRMTTSYLTKTSLSCFDSKRFLIDDIFSRPFGHFRNHLNNV